MKDLGNIIIMLHFKNMTVTNDKNIRFNYKGVTLVNTNNNIIPSI
jgi:hypothetical protein